MSNLRGALQHGAAYRNTPGKYANVWVALRARFGETALDIARPEKGLAAKRGEGARLQLAPRASNTMRWCPYYLRLRA